MGSGTNVQTNPKTSTTTPWYYDQYKTYSSSTPTSRSYKAYSSNGMTPEDAAWWQQATMALMNHYSDIKQGVDPEQSQYILRPEDLQQLMQWMQEFAYQRGIPFDPMAAGSSTQPMGPNGMPMGPEQNLVYKDTKNVVEIDGSVSQIDVWGNENIINFPPPWQVTSEFGTVGDPPTPALKIIGTDSSQKGPDGQPLKVVVYIHEYEGTDNTINTWTKGNGQSSLVDHTNGLVTSGEYKGVEGAGEEKLPVNKDHPEDMIPDEVGKETLTYNTTASGQLHADYDDQWPIHIIQGPGPFTFSGESYGDTYRLQYDPDTHTWTIYAYKDGDPNMVETFIIHGTEDTEIFINAMSKDMFVNTSEEAMDSVTIGLPGAEGAEGSSDTEDSGSASEIIQNLLAETGKNEGQMLKALENAGHPKFDSIEDLEKAIENGDFQFPPPDGPTGELLNFLYILDPDFQEKANAVAAAWEDGVSDDDNPLYFDAVNRVVELLSAIYPDSNIAAAGENAPGVFKFDGDMFSIGFTGITDVGRPGLHQWDGDSYEEV